MKVRSTLRALALSCLVFLPFLAKAQYNTPVVTDATITAGSYGTHTDGNNQQTNSGSGTVTYMTWDATNLYVAVTGANVSEAMVLYLDKNPVTPVNSTAGANGNTVGYGYDNTTFNTLPFLADLVVYFKNGYREYRTSNGSGAWSTQTSGFGSYSDNGQTNSTGIREIAIPWSAIGGIPTSFNHLEYLTSASGYVYGPTPIANPSGNLGILYFERYFTVVSTTSGSATKPFSLDSFTFNNISDETNIGALTLYDFTMNTAGRTITRASGAGGAWTINGNMVVAAGTASFGATTSGATVKTVATSGTGNLTLSSAIGGDLSVTGNFTNNGTFTPNSRAVTLNGTTAQTLAGTLNGAALINYFPYLYVTNTAGVTSGVATNVGTSGGTSFTVAASSKYTQSAGTLTLASGAISTINGTLWLNGTFANGGTTTISSTGILDIRAGGSVTTTGPTYAVGSTLQYNTGASQPIGAEWTAGATSGAGVPYNVIMGSAVAASGLSMGSVTSSYTVTNNLTLSAAATTGTLTLSTGANSFLYIGGNFSTVAFLAAGTNCTVVMNGTAAQTISGGVNPSFYKLSITNAAANVTAVNNFAVTNKLDINGSATLTRLDMGTNTLTLTGSTSTVTSGYLRSAVAIPTATTSTLTVAAAGTYEHNVTGATTIPTATWQANSTCAVIGAITTGGTMSGVNQGFSNFTWNCTGQTNTINFVGLLTSIGKDFTVTSTGSSTLRLSSGTTYTLAVGGNMSMAAGILEFTNGAGAPTINVAGNYTQSGGTVSMAASGASAASTLTVTGTFGLTGTPSFNLLASTTSTASSSVTVNGATSVNTSTGGISLESGVNTGGAGVFNANSDIAFSGSSISWVDFGASSTAANNNGNQLIVKGNFSTAGSGQFYMTGSPTSNNASTGIFFAKSGTQTATFGSSNPPRYTQFVVNSGTTLQMASSVTLSSATGPITAFLVNGILDMGTYTMTAASTTVPTFTLSSGATLKTANTAGVSGSIVSFGLSSTYANFSTTANYEFNGTSAQTSTGFNTYATTTGAANLTINNTGGTTGVTLDKNGFALTGALTFTSGLLTLGANDLTSTGSISGATAAKYVKTNSTGQLKRTVGAGAVTFPVGNSAYNPLILDNTGGTSDAYSVRVVDAAPPAALDATKTINRYWFVSETVAGGSNLAVTAQYNSGEEGTNYNAGTTPKLGLYTGTWVENIATLAGSNPYTAAASTYTPGSLTAGTGYFAIGKDLALTAPAVNYTWTGATDNSWGTATNWSPNGIPGATDNATVNIVGGFPLVLSGNRNITDFTLNGTGTFSANAGESLTISGVATYGGTASASLDPASTITYAGAASQTIMPLNYGILTSSSTGARVLSSTGTIGVAGTFTPGSNAYTITGSTVSFNGTGAQTIPAFNYNNLTLTGAHSGASNVTLASSGTIGIAGTLVATATFGSGNYVSTGSTVDYNGTSAQTVGAFLAYNNLTISQARGGATVTLASGTIGVGGVFNPSATGVVYSTTGNVFDYTAPVASQNIVAFNYNDLSSSGAGPRVLPTGATVGIAGTYTPPSGAVTVSTSTINFSSASSQPFPATLYYNVTNTGNGARVWANSGNIQIAGLFTPSTGLNTITGSTVVYNATSGTPWTVPAVTNTSSPGKDYNNVTFSASSQTFNQASNIATVGDFTITTGTYNISNATPYTLTVGGNFANNGAAMFAVANTTAAGTLTIIGNYSQSAGTTNVSYGTTSGGVGSMTVGGTFGISGGVLNVIATSAAPNTTVTVTGAVTVSGSGSIVLETGSSTSGAGIFIAQSDVSFTGTSPAMVGWGGSTNIGGNEFRIGGNFSKTGTGNFSAVASTAPAPNGFVFNKAGTQTFTYSSTNSTKTSYVVNSGSTLQMLSGVVVTSSTPTSSFTVNGTIDMGTQIISGTGIFTLASGGTLITANTTGIPGSVTITTTSFSSAANYTFNSAVGVQNTGTFTTTPTASTVANLTLANSFGSTGVSLSSALTVNGALTFTSGLLTLGSNTLTLGASATTSGAGTGKYVDASSTGGLLRKTLATGVATAFPIGTSTIYAPVTITNQQVTGVDFTAQVKTMTGIPIDATKVVNLEWPIATTSTNADVAFSWPNSTPPQGASFNPAGTIELGKLAAGLYPIVPGQGSLTATGSYTVTATGLTSFGTFALGNSTFLGSSVQTYTWTGAVSSDWGTNGNWNIAGFPTASDNAIVNVPGANTLTINTTRAITDFTLNGTGAIILTSGGTLTVNGNLTTGGSATATFDPASTFNVTSATSQAIPAYNYGNLNLTGGARVLASSGTIGIAGAFTPGAGAYTITGSTVNYNGTGTQTVSAATYNNLTISGARAAGVITLPAGTISVAGAFSVTATGYTVTNTGNTLDFASASAQTVPAFFYNNLTNTGNGARTISATGTIDIAGSFTPSTGTTTTTGSSVKFSSTAATTITLPVFTSTTANRGFNNLEFVGGASTVFNLANSYSNGVTGNLVLSGAGTLNVVSSANTTTQALNVDGNLNLTGSGTINVCNGSFPGTLTVTGNANISNGTLVGTNTSSTGLTNYFKPGTLTVSGTGKLNLESSSTSSYTLVQVTTDVTVTSTTTNAIDLGSGTANGTSVVNGNVVTIGGNFSKSGAGTIGLSGTYSQFAGYFFAGAGTQTLSYSGAGVTGGNIGVNSGSTLQLNTDLTFGATGTTGFAVIGRLNAGAFSVIAGNATSGFSTNGTGSILSTAKAGGLSAAASGFLAAATAFPTGTTFEYVGASQSTGFSTYSASLGNTYIITWLGTAGNLTLDNPVTVSALNLTNAGLFILGSNNLTVTSAGTITGSPFSATKMIEADGTGSLIRSVTAAGVGIPFTWPIGDNTSGAEYSPVTIGSVTMSIAGTIGFRVTDAAQPNVSPATNYLTRYWTYSYTGGSYSWGTATFTYTAADVVGVEANLKADVYGNTTPGWTEYASSSAASNVLTLASGPSSSTLTSGDDFTGRLDVPVYYRSAAAGPATWTTPATWEISTDPAFVSPAAVGASTFPNATNSAGITIRAGHTVNYTTGTISVDQLTVAATGILNTTGGNFNLAGTNPALTLSGTWNIGSSSVTVWNVSSVVSIPTGGYLKNSSTSTSTAGTITIAGTYESAVNGNSIPTAIWSSGSLCTVTGVGATAPGGLGQNFYDFTWSSPQSASVGLAGALGNIQNDFTVNNTGTAELRLGSSQSISMTVGRDLTINSGATLVMYSAAVPATATLSIGRDLNINGTGTFQQTTAGASGTNTTTTSVARDVNMAGTTGIRLAITGTASGTTSGILNVTGNINHSGTGLVRLNTGSGTGTLNVTGNYLMTSTGTLDFGSSTVGGILNLLGDFSHPTGSILSNTGSGSPTINFKKATGTQTWTPGGTASVGSGGTINLGTGSTTNTVVLAASGAVTANIIQVNAGTTFDMGTSVLSGTASFQAQNAGILKIGSTTGIATTGATGNVQTTSRSFNPGGSYVYTGAANQITGTGLPTSFSNTTGYLGISNTGTGGNNTVTLTNSGTTVYNLALTSGLFAVGSGNTLAFNTNGTVAGNGGDFATGATGGTLSFGSAGVFSGISNPYNVYAASGVNFGASTVTIQSGGAFRINTGGFATGNAPYYAAGSTLQYNSGGNYGRGIEWTAASGRAYPSNVQISNNTTFQPGGNGRQGVTLNMGGNLTVDAGSAMYLDFGGMVMTVDFNTLGSVNLAGNLSLSTSTGDWYIGGDWTRTGVFSPNTKEVIFNGTAAQAFTGTTAFNYLRIKNTAGAGLGVTLGAASVLTVSNRLAMDRGLLVLGANSVTVGSAGFIQWVNSDTASYIVTNGTGTVTQTVVSAGGAQFFPVGPSASQFNSLTLLQNAAGTTDTYTVRAVATPFSPVVSDATKLINVQYLVTEGVAGGGNLRTTIGWTRLSENANFDRNAGIFHGNYTAGAYAVRAGGALSGTNPYFNSSAAATPLTASLTGANLVFGNINGIVPCFTTAGAGDWNTAATWTANLVPPTDALVCIGHALTVNATPSGGNPGGVSVSTGGSLSIASGITLSIQSGGSFTNGSGAGATIGGLGTVSFVNTGLVNGGNATTFYNLQLNGNTTMTTAPTVSNQLEIKAGGFILSGSVNYGAASTLLYNTNGSYGRSNEWNATSGAGFPHNVQVSGTTALDISNGSNAARAIGGSFTVDATASATMSAMTGNLTVPVNFNLNGSFTESSAVGGDIILGGSWSSGAAASFTSNNRDVNFNGSVAQTIATAGPITFGYVTIDNSAGGVTLLNNITVNTFRVNATRTFSLGANKITVASGGAVQIGGIFNANTGTIEYSNGGSFTNNGTFTRGTSTIDFVGSGTGSVTGTVQTNFHNIRLYPGGGIDFGSGALRGRVSGTFSLRPGSFVTGNAPIYEFGSKLQYAGGGTFNRNIEWDTATVQKVEVTNSTILNGGTNGTGFTHKLADSLIVQSGSSFDMTTPNMTAKVIVGGTMLVKGNVYLSQTSGGDLQVRKDFVNNGGNFVDNGRLTTFYGDSNSSIAGSTNTTFSLLTVYKSPGKILTPAVPFTLSRAGGSALRVASGILNLNGQTYTLGAGANVLQVDRGMANGQTLRTGGSSLTGFSVYTSTGANTDTLGGTIAYNSASNETLLPTVYGYSGLTLSGGNDKFLTHSIRVNDSLVNNIAYMKTSGASTVVLVRGAVVNNGDITGLGAGAGKLVLAGSATQNISGNGNYRTLEVNNASDINSTGHPTVTDSLKVVNGKVFSTADTIILGSSGVLAERIAATQNFVRGFIKTTHVTGTGADTYGGLGFELTAGSNLGTVKVLRQSGTPVAGSGVCCSSHHSILRTYTVKPSQQPVLANRNVYVKWPSQDDNGQNMNLMQLWKSPDGIAPYAKIGSMQNVSISNPRVAFINNIPSFSVFTAADDINPLPLGLLSFSGKLVNKAAQLSWTMTNEKAWAGFIVERSADGKQFTDLGRVAALENGRSENTYGYADRSIATGSYYRLRLTGLAGETDYSEVVFISLTAIGSQEQVLSLYPNPTARGAKLALDGRTDLADPIKADIVTIEGRLIETLEGTLSDVNQALEARTETLPAGLYQIKVTTTGQVKAIKLIKR